MTARILRIELLRSTAPWIAVLIVGLGAAAHYVPASSRDGWWTMLAFEGRLMLVVLWPLALGAGAWQARRDRRSSMAELIATTPRPQRRRVVPIAVAMAIGVVTGYLGAFAAGIPSVLPYATYFPAAIVPIVAVGVLAVIAAAWLGLGLGSLRPSVLMPPMLGIGAVALLASIRALPGRGEPHVPGAAFFLPTLQGSDLVHSPEFLAVTARAHLSQVVWLVALAVAGLAVFAAATRRGRLAAILPVALGVAIALPLQPATVAAGYEPDRIAIAQVCTPDTPRVCVPKAHEGVLTDLREPARQALAILSAKLPNAPTAVAEDDRQRPRESNPQTVTVGSFRVSGGRIDDPTVPDPPRNLLWQLLDGAGTQWCANLDFATETGFARYVMARLVAAAWLIGDLPANPPLPPDVGTTPEQALDKLRGLPAEEQRARVAALRDAELSCTGGDRLDMLIGPSGSR
jgi:hypothetical protein